MNKKYLFGKYKVGKKGSGSRVRGSATLFSRNLDWAFVRPQYMPAKRYF